MSMTQILQRQLTFRGEPQAIVSYLQQHLQLNHTLLLESREIQSRQNLSSYLTLGSALQIQAVDGDVTLSAQSANGSNALASICEHLPAGLITQQSATKCVLSFGKLDTNCSEQQRLLQAHPVDILRIAHRCLSNPSLPDYGLMLAGVLGFDLIASSEQLPTVASAENQCPDYLFVLPEQLLIFDHQSHSLRLVSYVYAGSNAAQIQQDQSAQLSKLVALIEKYDPKPLLTLNPVTPTRYTCQVDVSDNEFAQQVETLQSYIRDGEIFQVVPSRTFSLEITDPLLAYAHLTRQNPSPYQFFMQDKAFCLFGASPESALKVDVRSRRTELYPIAGTRARAFDEQGQIDTQDDARVELELKQDEKEIAEHLMLVDLARNDLARICEPRSIAVPRLMEVDRYSRVMHLVSKVCGELKPDYDALHAYLACMNMGTLTGAPKVRATELIREVEKKRRGSYGGAIGYLNNHGDMDTCILIRSAYCVNGRAYVQAGAGVVFDSNPQAEADETRAKASAVLSAIAAANQQCGARR